MKKYLALFSTIFIALWFMQCAKHRYPTTDSKQTLNLYTTGEEYRMKLYHRNALNNYLQAFRLDTNFAMAALRSGQMYLSFGMGDSGEYYFEKAHEKSTYLPDVERLIVDYHWSEFTHNSERRAVVTDSLIKYFPNNFDVRIINAMDKWEKLEFDNARKLYQNLLRENPNYIIAYNNIGYLYARKGLFKEAIDNLEKYKRYAADQLNPYDSLAEIYLAIGRYYEAIHLLEYLIDNRSDELIENEYLGVIIYTRLTNAYRCIGKYQKALSILDEAEKLFSSNHSFAQINLTRFSLYRDLNQIDHMEATVKSLLNVLSEEKFPYQQAIVYIEKNNFDEVLNILKMQKSKSESGKNISRTTLIQNTAIEAELNFKTGLFGEAAEQFKLAADTYNDTLYAVNLRIKQYISEGKSGNYQAAIDGLRSRIKVNPNCPLALVNISEFYVKTGKESEAQAYLSHFRNLWKNADPDTPLMLQADAILSELNQPN